jgi:hypothetical protein
LNLLKLFVLSGCPELKITFDWAIIIEKNPLVKEKGGILFDSEIHYPKRKNPHIGQDRAQQFPGGQGSLDGFTVLSADKNNFSYRRGDGHQKPEVGIGGQPMGLADVADQNVPFPGRYLAVVFA